MADEVSIAQEHNAAIRALAATCGGRVLWGENALDAHVWAWNPAMTKSVKVYRSPEGVYTVVVEKITDEDIVRRLLTDLLC
jgi:hypothetical protein